MSTNIVIIGAGRIGRAIECILSKKQAMIELWDKDTSKVPSQKDLARILPSADFIFICVSSWATSAVLGSINKNIKPDAIVISFAKGLIDGERPLTIDELLIKHLGNTQPRAFVYGPMMAEELNKGLIGVGVAACESMVFKKLAELFAGTNLNIEHSTDFKGVAFAGVLKNIYAIGLGIADGLAWGCNAKGWYAAEAVKEMADIIESLGGHKETGMGAAGFGDFIATGFSPHSRNRRVGDELIQTGKCCLQSEGIVSLPSLMATLGDRAKKYKILSALIDIVASHKNAREIFTSLI